MKLYIVKILYDYECSSIYGVFDSKEEAEKHKAILEANEEEMCILDGVVICEETLNKPDWDITQEDVYE